jgi:hypothetical protein
MGRQSRDLAEQIFLRQRNSVHLMADAASYEMSTGILISNNLAKCVALPTLSAAISCTGPADLGAYFGYILAQKFSSFDELILSAEQYLPKLFENFADETRRGDALSTLYLIGWHKAEARPAAYAMDLWTDESTRIAQVLDNGKNAASTQALRFKLNEQLFAGTPLPGADLIAAAGLKILDDENDMKPDLDLLHLMEVQRHEEIEGHYWVGGKALLTSIDCRGITQRVVHHWQEDQIGQPITPLPIAWKAWREARVAAKIAAIVPDGLSRLQRGRMEKKARKGTLRATL